MSRQPPPGCNLVLYQEQHSGNCYKARMILARSKTPFAVRAMDISAGQTQTAEFLSLNPNGKVPYLAWEKDGKPLCGLGESNAILLYFARGGEWLPSAEWDLAKVYEWLFFEQYSHEPAIAVRRTLLRRGAKDAARLDDLLQKGRSALAVMEKRLTAADWLAGGKPTVADLSLYAYTHLAEEGGFDFAAFPAVAAWLARVAELPGHIDIDWTP